MTIDALDIQQLARVIAASLSDDYDRAPFDKAEWTRKSGVFFGTPRPFELPTREDYEHAAKAAIAFLEELTEGAHHGR
ncbi:MAG: hypothetical protein QW318_07515 [Candidatus Caldarchaeum sp.]